MFDDVDVLDDSGGIHPGGTSEGTAMIALILGGFLLQVLCNFYELGWRFEIKMDTLTDKEIIHCFEKSWSPETVVVRTPESGSMSFGRSTASGMAEMALTVPWYGCLPGLSF